VIGKQHPRRVHVDGAGRMAGRVGRVARGGGGGEVLRRLVDDRRCHGGGTEPPQKGGVEALPGGEEAEGGVAVL